PTLPPIDLDESPEPDEELFAPLRGSGDVRPPRGSRRVPKTRLPPGEPQREETDDVAAEKKHARVHSETHSEGAPSEDSSDERRPALTSKRSFYLKSGPVKRKELSSTSRRALSRLSTNLSTLNSSEGPGALDTARTMEELDNFDLWAQQLLEKELNE
ncbi:MAG TPA: hypothetical protein VJ884_07770, partial [Salinibacter sp.]|nr:hypothetical protein [Salinibacter sp.]